MKPVIQCIMCDPYLAGIYGRKFELEGFDVYIDESVDEALRDASRYRPNALLYDIHCTPDPEEVVRQMRSHAVLSNSKILLLGSVTDWDRVQELAELADGYLIFGHFVPSDAVNKVKQLLSI